MLLAAGFDVAHVWLRPMRSADSATMTASQRQKGSEQGRSGRRGRRGDRQNRKPGRGTMPSEAAEAEHEHLASDVDDEGDGEEDFKEWTGISGVTTDERTRINLGWTAYIVGVASPRAAFNNEPNGAQPAAS